MRTRYLLAALTFTSFACAADPGDETDHSNDPEGDYFEGEQYDELNPRAELESGGKMDGGYVIPDVESLEHPEIIVSLEQYTVHLFDRTSGFSEVYPAGVGILGSNGSITPTGHFKTWSDTSDSWYYTEKRWSPAYYDGKPFLRINAKNSQGAHTYGLHGPIDPDGLHRGNVSHGCIRMQAKDIIELFWRVRLHPSTPVTFQDEPELDADGNLVDVDTTPVLWDVGEEIEYGASAG